MCVATRYATLLHNKTIYLGQIHLQSKPMYFTPNESIFKAVT